MTLKPLLWACLLLVVIGCKDSGTDPGVDGNQAGDPTGTNADRWYSAAQVARGQEIFAANCAVCHGDRAQGLAEDWRQRLPDGSYPPPPLDGSAHAWHHPLAQLGQIIETGGQPYGGQMPPFGAVLDEPERLAAIAFFQNLWTDDIYRDWLAMGGLP